MGDIEYLVSCGLLLGHALPHGFRFDITPVGFSFYEEAKQQTGQPTQRVKSSIKTYFDSTDFQKVYSQAYIKWSEAESLLWRSDSLSQLTTIGHLCREAMQEFASACVERYRLSDIDKDKAHIIERLRAVLTHFSARLGHTEKPLYDALLVYWGTLSDLVQRQEHGAQKEGQQLIWEDGRRVVFQTAVVMFEVDRVLSRSQ